MMGAVIRMLNNKYFIMLDKRCSVILNKKCCLMLNKSGVVWLNSISADKELSKDDSTGKLPKLAAWMKLYEDTIGISDVKEAQNYCIVTEKKLVEAQEIRRDVQLKIQQVQTKLRDINVELEKSSRGEAKYIQLITQEYTITEEVRKLQDEFQLHEKTERQYFSALSNAVRESHERERAYAEKTKYWSIIGSVCGAVIGIIGTSITNWVRIRELRDLVRESATVANTTMTSGGTSFQETMSAVSNNLQVNQEKILSFIKGQTETSNAGRSAAFEGETMQMLTSIATINEGLKEKIDDIKSVLLAKRMVEDIQFENDSQVASHLTGAVIYLGRDVEHMVKDAQHNLEWKIKVSSIATVAMIYGGIAVALPILYNMFGGKA